MAQQGWSRGRFVDAFSQVSELFPEMTSVRVRSYCLHHITAVQSRSAAISPHLRLREGGGQGPTPRAPRHVVGGWSLCEPLIGRARGPRDVARGPAPNCHGTVPATT